MKTNNIFFSEEYFYFFFFSFTTFMRRYLNSKFYIHKITIIYIIFTTKLISLTIGSNQGKKNSRTYRWDRGRETIVRIYAPASLLVSTRTPCMTKTSARRWQSNNSAHCSLDRSLSLFWTWKMISLVFSILSTNHLLWLELRNKLESGGID